MYKRFYAMVLGIIFVMVSGNAFVSAQEAPSREAPDMYQIFGGESYTLGASDVVSIAVRNQSEFSGDFEIGPDGNIQYSFIGDIKAEGLTKYELRDAVVRSLEKYVKAPEVSVTIAEYRSKNVYILGEVGNPGRYPLRGDSISLKEAIVEAGLPTRSAALRRIYIVKSDEANPTYKKIDLFKILYKGYTKNNIDLVPGDIVVVPSTVPAEINRALTTLLTPATAARGIDETRTYRWGASDDE